MSFVITTGSTVMCSHMAQVQLAPSQNKLVVAGKPALVMGDMEGKPIAGCPLASPGSKPCTTIISTVAGMSTRLFVDGKPVLLDNASGVTDSVPPGTWSVRSAGQTRLESS